MRDTCRALLKKIRAFLVLALHMVGGGIGKLNVREDGEMDVFTLIISVRGQGGNYS